MRFLKCYTQTQLHQFSCFTTESQPRFIDTEFLKVVDDDDDNLPK